MTDPAQDQRANLQTLAVEVANLATEVAELAHRISDEAVSDTESEMLMRVSLTRTLWIRDALAATINSTNAYNS